MMMKNNPPAPTLFLAISVLCLTVICIFAMYMQLDGVYVPLSFSACITTIVGWVFGRDSGFKECLQDFIRKEEQKSRFLIK